MRIDSSAATWVLVRSSPFFTTAGRVSLSVNGTSSSIFAFGKGGSSENYILADAGGLTIANTSATLPTTFFNNASSSMTISAAGDLGIGVTPTAFSSRKSLDIGLGGKLWALTSATETGIGNNFYFDGAYKRLTTNYASRHIQDSSGHTFDVAVSGSADSAISWNSALTIDTSGNVGIGCTPGYTFEVRTNDTSATPQQVIRQIGSGDAAIGFQIPSAANWYAGVDNSASDSFVIGRGLAVGTDVAMTLDASGRVTMPYQPAFQVVAAIQNNIPINANTTVNFTSEVFDQGSNYAGTSFTAPVTGKYQLNLSLYTLAIDSDADYVQVAIVTSNRQYYAIVDPSVWTGDPTYWSFAITVLADMDASDTAHVEVQLNNTGAAQMDITASSVFSGYLVA